MFAGENIVTPAAVILSITVSVTLDDAAPMMASTFSDRCRSVVWSAWLRRRVTGVAGDVDDVLAEHATGLVDLVDGELDAGELGWSEERQRAGLRQQRADREHAVTLAGALDRNVLGELRLTFDHDVLGQRRVDAVVVTDLQQAVAGDRRLAVAVELERTGGAVVVDVLTGGDEVAALDERSCTSSLPW